MGENRRRGVCVAAVATALLALAVPTGAAGYGLYASGGSGHDVAVLNTDNNSTTNVLAEDWFSTRTLTVSPNGKSLYVGTLDKLFTVDTQSDAILAPSVPLAIDEPQGTSAPNDSTVTPDGSRLYVATDFDLEISVIDTSSNSVVTEVSTPGQAHAVEADPRGGRVFFLDSNGVRTIDTATNAASGVLNPIDGNNAFEYMVVSPDGSRLYVTDGSNDSSVTVVDANTFATIGTIDTASFGRAALAISPDGSRLYAASFLDNFVEVYDTSSFAPVSAPIQVGEIGPTELTFTPDGSKLYVGGDDLVEIDPATNTVVAPNIPVGNFFEDPGYLAVSTLGPAPPRPTSGKTVNLAPVKGKVLVGCKKGKFKKLKKPDQVKVGCVVDTTKGTVRLTSERSDESTQTLDYYGGVFKVQQKKGNDTTTLQLPEGEGCGGSGGKKRAVYAKGGKGNGLWGKGKGDVRTQGASGSASVRGTTWLTEDRCDGSTFFQVKDGTVKVKDDVKNKTITLKAGDSYLAKAK